MSSQKTQKPPKGTSKRKTYQEPPTTISSQRPSYPNKKAKKSKPKASSPEASDAESSLSAAEEAVAEKIAEDSDEEEEEEEGLHGFSTDDDDSSDEEDGMDAETSAFDVSALPTIAKDDATVKRKLEKAKRQPVSRQLKYSVSRTDTMNFCRQKTAVYCSLVDYRTVSLKTN